MYEVDLETHPDIPGFEDVAVEPFEDWMAHHMRRPADSPEATFIALAGEEVVGFAKLSLTAPAAAGHAMTAVKRAWRGRGIAGALKATEINWATARCGSADFNPRVELSLWSALPTAVTPAAVGPRRWLTLRPPQPWQMD
jgi:GNAT superfamily N-acetyltransferase